MRLVVILLIQLKKNKLNQMNGFLNRLLDRNQSNRFKRTKKH